MIDVTASESASEAAQRLADLKKAAAFYDAKTYGPAYRAAFEGGERAVAIASKELLDADWSVVDKAIELRIFRALFLLLHELDEDEAAKVRESLSKEKLDPSIASELRRISQLRQAAYLEFVCCSVAVFLSRDLANQDHIQRYLTKWLSSVPEDHLAKLDRIYVVPEGRCGEDFRGYFEPGLRRICIEWLSQFDPSSFVDRLYMDTSGPELLFHEIGHHVLGHQGGPTDADKEKAADTYSRLLAARTSKVAALIVPLATAIHSAYGVLSRRKHRWRRDLIRHWQHEGLEFRNPASPEQIQSFAKAMGIGVPTQLKQLLLEANGMAPNAICGNGFCYRGFEEMEVLRVSKEPKEEGASQIYLAFADHVPNGVTYFIEVSEGQTRTPSKVFRDGCQTRSGLLQVAASMAGFAHQYRENRPYLFA